MTEFTQRWTAAQPAVASYISFGVRSFHDAQDVLQEVAAALVAQVDRYDAAQPFLPWALGIARHKIVDFRRRQGAGQLVLDHAALDELASAYQRVAPRIDLWQEALEHCVGRVGGKSRRLLEMRYQQDLKPGEMARELQTNVGALKMALHRVRHALRDCVETRLAQEGSA